MSSLYIIKTGSTFPTFAPDHGDFEDWVRKGLGNNSELDVRVIGANKGEALPHPDTCAGIVITGSHAMVTDKEPWSETIAAWLPEVIAADVPVLGICYGHQLLAHATGGVVGYHPHGKEIGTVPVELTESAESDALFSGLPKAFTAHATHSQTVLGLPEGAVHLASNEFEPHHAFRVGKAAWGVQFHPEFDAPIMREYIEQQAEPLRRDNQNPEELVANVSDTPVAAEVLRRFSLLALKELSSK